MGRLRIINLSFLLHKGHSQVNRYRVLLEGPVALAAMNHCEIIADVEHASLDQSSSSEEEEDQTTCRIYRLLCII